MSSVRLPDTGDRYRRGRFARTESGSLDLDLDLARDELTRAQVALLRERSRERRQRVYLEDDDFNCYHSRYGDDELEEMVRHRCRLIEREAQTARYADTDHPMARPRRPLSDVPSSVLDSRRGTGSSAPSPVGGSSVSSLGRLDRDIVRVEEIERILRENERFVRDQHLSTRSINSSISLALERLNTVRSASQPLVARPTLVRPANPSGKPAIPSTEVLAIIPNQKPPPEVKNRNKRLDLLWSQPVGLIHDLLSKSRVKSSGEWIFALPAFESWRKATTESPKFVERGGNCLWLNGGLGAGKTMLM
jgi:hypothetical protein